MKTNLITTCLYFESGIVNCFLTLLISVFAITAYAQVSISNPINKAVYQRTGTGDGNADLVVSGSYSVGIATSVQARLVTPVSNNPISGFDWKIIDKAPSKSVFYGILSAVPAGWYTLQVRVVKEGVEQESAQVDRVGVGDVFLIAGQSNSAGENTSGFLGATDERVVSDNLSLSCVAPNTFPGYPEMEQIMPNTMLAINGTNAWAYGKLGDDLVTQTGFPVAFFNAGTGGASIQNFTQSMLGQATNHPFTGFQFCNGVPNAVGQPYRTISTTMSYYNSLFGMKAVLWHQGESDTHLNTTALDYENRLTSLINFVRNDFDPSWSMPWVVSRASYESVFSTSPLTSAFVIAGQNNVILNVPSVFAGPMTDGIEGPNRRDDGTHFNDLGLFDLANAWKNSLNSTFFTSTTAKAANTQPAVSITRNGSNVTLSVPTTNIAAFKWVNGNNFEDQALSTSSSYTHTTGTVRCYLTDNNGNIRVTQSVNIDAVKSQSDNNLTCSTVTPLSDLKPFSILNDLGPISLNKSIGGTGDGDGQTMKLNGVSYAKGIGVNSNSELVYLLPSNTFQTFVVDIGIDDEVGNQGTVKFQIFNDNTLLYESPTMTGSSNTIQLNQNIAGVTILRLKVIDLDGNTNDHANWANGRFFCNIPDLIPPSSPSALTVSNPLSRCTTITWTASTDNVGIAGYDVFKNGELEVSIPSTQLSYNFINLLPNTTYNFGIRAFDNSGNQSSISPLSTSTLSMSAKYPGNPNPLFGDICVNTVEIPSKSPAGGIFEFVSGQNNYSLNSSTGAFSSSVADGFFTIKYIVDKNGVCKDSITVNVRTNTKPAAPIISGPSIVNANTPAIFNSTTCSGNYILWPNGSFISPATFSLSDTTTVFAFCRNNGCLSDTSNTILVKVIPDCPNTFNLISPIDDLGGASSNLNFKAATKLEASNKLTTNSITSFKAAQAVILKPGFSADSGTVFSATIGGCP